MSGRGRGIFLFFWPDFFEAATKSNSNSKADFRVFPFTGNNLIYRYRMNIKDFCQKNLANFLFLEGGFYVYQRLIIHSCTCF